MEQTKKVLKLQVTVAEAKATPQAKAKVEDMVASKAKAKVAAASKIEDVDDLVSEELCHSVPPLTTPLTTKTREASRGALQVAVTAPK